MRFEVSEVCTNKEARLQYSQPRLQVACMLARETDRSSSDSIRYYYFVCLGMTEHSLLKGRQCELKLRPM